MKPFAWNGIHCKLPDDWELLQFSKLPEKGRVAFGDRYQLRFEIDWAVVDKPPVLDRMVEDYKAKLVTDGIQHPRLVNHHPWQGVTGIEDDMRLSRYCLYSNRRSLLIEAIFLWPQEESPKHNHQFEATILESFNIPPLQEDGRQEWNAFSIHCLAPDTHQLDECIANPANVKMVFCDEKQQEFETVQRMGGLKAWLAVGVDQWLKDLVPKNFTITEMTHTAQEEHQVWTVEATISKAVLKDWWKGRRHFTAAAWICPHDKRLYAVTKTTHDYKDGRQPLPISLTCCPQLEITL